jgi:hypothetical protein
MAPRTGPASAATRALRLYKRECGSLAKDCQKKRGWQKAYTNYVIRAADVVESLPAETATIVANEAAAREPAEPPDRSGVVHAIVDEGKPSKGRVPPPMAKGHQLMTS